jgi:hypothetical protein
MTTDNYPVDDRGYTATPGAAEYYDVSVTKLEKDRHYGVGAEYIKIGSAVRYSYAALDAEATKHRLTCTRD